MKRIHKSIAALLAAILLPQISAAAEGGSFDIKLVGTSSDIASGYYAKFSVNGKTYRSDEMGADFNMGAWNRLGDGDRRSIMKAFAFASWARQEQFGTEGSAAMCDYINESTGWKQGAEVLRKRVEEKYCNELAAYYGGGDSQMYEVVALSDTAQRVLGYSPDKGWYYEDVEELREKAQALGQLWQVGNEAYNCVLNLRYQCTQISVKAISGDLISIITDKMLVPNITPAGTGGAMTSIATNVFDLINSLTGMTDDLMDKLVGKRASASDAAEIVTGLAKIADGNYEIAKQALSDIDRLRSEIEAAAPALLEKIESGKLEAEKQKRLEDEEKAYSDYLASEPGPSSSVAQSWASRKPIEPKRESYEEYEDYEKAHDAWADRYSAYISDAFTQAVSYETQLEAIEQEAKDFYDSLWDYLPQYNSVYENEPWMITEYMMDVSADKETIKMFEEVAERKRQYLRDKNSAQEEMIAKAKEKLSELESRAYGIVPNEKGIYKGVNDPYNLGTLDARPVDLSILNLRVRFSLEDIDRNERELEIIEGKMDQFRRDREAWLEGLRNKAKAYEEAQDNYLMASAYYDNAFDSAVSLLKSLPDYVKNQEVREYTNTVYAGRSYNPTLADMLSGKDQKEKNAMLRRLMPELRSKYREYLKYQRQMKAAQNYMKADREQLLNNVFYWGTLADFAKEYGIGGGLQETGDILSYGKVRYLETEQRFDAEALGLLYNDFAAQGRFHTDMLKLGRDIETNRGKLLSEGDRSAYDAYERQYDSLLSQTNYNPLWGNSAYSYYGFGDDDIEAAPVRAALDDIENKLDSGYQQVLSLSGSSNGVTLSEGGSAQLAAQVYPADATEQQIIWKSSNENAAIVDENGNVRAVGAGEAVITAYSRDSIITAVYETDENGEHVLNAANQPVIKGYEYEPAALTYTVTVNEDPAKGDGYIASEVDGYSWKNYGSSAEPETVLTQKKGDELIIKAQLRAEDASGRSVYLALYDEAGRLVGVALSQPPEGEGEFELIASCREADRPSEARCFIFGTDSMEPVMAGWTAELNIE